MCIRDSSNTPLQVEVDLLRTKTHEATHVSAGHLAVSYTHLDVYKRQEQDSLQQDDGK